MRADARSWAAAFALAIALGAGAWAPAAGASATCPATDPNPVLSARPGTGRTLVPNGARSVLLCRYSGLPNGIGIPHPAYVLLANVFAGSGAAASLGRALDQLGQTASVSTCPTSFGAVIVAHFRYARGPDDPVTIALDGCLKATNGHLTRTAETAPGIALVTHIAALTGLRLLR